MTDIDEMQAETTNNHCPKQQWRVRARDEQGLVHVERHQAGHENSGPAPPRGKKTTRSVASRQSTAEPVACSQDASAFLCSRAPCAPPATPQPRLARFLQRARPTRYPSRPARPASARSRRVRRSATRRFAGASRFQRNVVTALPYSTGGSGAPQDSHRALPEHRHQRSHRCRQDHHH